MGGSYAGRGIAHGGTAVRPGNAACCARTMSTTRSSTARPTADRRRPTPRLEEAPEPPDNAGCRARCSSSCWLGRLHHARLRGGLPHRPAAHRQHPACTERLHRPRQREPPLAGRRPRQLPRHGHRLPAGRAARRHRAHVGPRRRRPEPQRHAGLGGVDPPRRLGRRPRPRASQDQQRRTASVVPRCSCGPSSSSPTTASTTSRIIDYAGFQHMVDAVGGIDIEGAHLDGPAALAYVSQGTANPAEYRDRLAHQQTAIRALIDKATTDGLLGDPLKLFRLLDALSKAVSVDETLTSAGMDALGLQMRGLRTANTQFAVAPVRGIGRGRAVGLPGRRPVRGAAVDRRARRHGRRLPQAVPGRYGQGAQVGSGANGPAATTEREGDERHHSGRGLGTRLHPITRAVSKQLLPVYDKPMIYYPLSVLMLAGIREILIICTPHDLPQFQRLLGDGARARPVAQLRGAAAAATASPQAFVIGADHVGDEPGRLMLGDNIFHGPGFSADARRRDRRHRQGRRRVRAVRLPGARPAALRRRPRPTRGLAALDRGEAQAAALEPRGHRPVLLRQRRRRHRELRPSARGELEITDVNRAYLERGAARIRDLGRGFAWLDTGTHESLLEAGEYVQMLENRQGLRIACVEEIAFGWASSTPRLLRAGRAAGQVGYGQYVMDVARSRSSAVPGIERRCASSSPAAPASSARTSSARSAAAPTRRSRAPRSSCWTCSPTPARRTNLAPADDPLPSSSTATSATPPPSPGVLAGADVGRALRRRVPRRPLDPRRGRLRPHQRRRHAGAAGRRRWRRASTGSCTSPPTRSTARSTRARWPETHPLQPNSPVHRVARRARTCSPGPTTARTACPSASRGAATTTGRTSSRRSSSRCSSRTCSTGSKVPLYGDGLNVRDWLHVDDHCRASSSCPRRGRDGRGLQHRRQQRADQPRPHPPAAGRGRRGPGR